MRSLAVVAVALAAGAAGGVGAGFFAGRGSSGAATEARGRDAQSPGLPSKAREQRLALERGQTAPTVPEALVPAQPSAAAASQEPGHADQLTPAERAQRWQQMYSGKIAAVQAEARDPAWAPATEQAFKHDFLAQSDAFKGRLLEVDCRTTGCLARVEWSSYPLAKQQFRDVLQASFKVNCASTIDIGAEPARPTDPVQATVVFECEEARIKQTAGG